VMTQPKPDKVQGPASYFPSIEKKYGRPVEEWQAVVRSAPGYGAGANHMGRVALHKDQHRMGHGHPHPVVAPTHAPVKT
jgi:hypothetical protein